jgi:hypothetical protein
VTLWFSTSCLTSRVDAPTDTTEQDTVHVLHEHARLKLDLARLVAAHGWLVGWLHFRSSRSAAEQLATGRQQRCLRDPC